MKALYNDQIVEDHLILPFNDRALQFGDGLFETIIVTNNAIPLMPYHIRRLKKGAKCLKMDLIKPKNIEEQIFTVLQANGLNKHARVKVQLWRRPNPNPGYSISTSTINLISMQVWKGMKKDLMTSS